jgi:hypothetical protein
MFNSYAHIAGFGTGIKWWTPFNQGEIGEKSFIKVKGDTHVRVRRLDVHHDEGTNTVMVERGHDCIRIGLACRRRM